MPKVKPSMNRLTMQLALLIALAAGCEMGRAPGLTTPLSNESVAGNANTPSHADGTALRGTYKVVNVGTTLAFATAHGSRDDGAQIWGWPYDGNNAQKWAMQPVGEMAYTFTNIDSNKVLDSAGGIDAHATTNAVAVQQWDYRTGDANQLWRVALSEDRGSYTIANVATAMCLGFSAMSDGEGTYVTQSPCASSPLQTWGLTAVAPTSSGDGPNPSVSPTPVSTPTPTPKISPTITPTAPTVPDAPAIAGLHVSGTTLVDGSGKVVRFHGVNIPSLEWSNGEPTNSTQPCYSGQTIMDTVKKAIGTYKVNFIRLPISQDRWMNKVDGQGPTYRNTVSAIVSYATQNNVYVDIDLHWSDMGVWGQNLNPHMMPDDNTPAALKDIAETFMHNQMVLIGTYNEPHGVSWDIWRDGGSVTEGAVTYHTPGIQSLINTIRSTGALNVIMAGGLDWSSDLSGVVNGYPLMDINLAMDAHVYPWKGQPADWDAKMGVAHQKYALIVGEYGAAYTWLDSWATPQDFLNGAHAWVDKYEFGFAIWAMHPAGNPAMIADWCYTPTSYFGSVVIPWLGN